LAPFSTTAQQKARTLITAARYETRLGGWRSRADLRMWPVYADADAVLALDARASPRQTPSRRG
jgi:hypothetical protein